jgi:hypothetical protein
MNDITNLELSAVEGGVLPGGCVFVPWDIKILFPNLPMPRD